MNIQIIGRVIIIWDEVFLKLIVSVDGMVIRKKVLLGSIHHIETHLDVVVEVLEVNISVAFELFIGEESIEFWWSDIMF